jgi:hypothetical protein
MRARYACAIDSAECRPGGHRLLQRRDRGLVELERRWGGGRRRAGAVVGRARASSGEAGDAEAGADEARGAGGAGMKEGASVHA